MLTEKDYCDYKLVLELKELGYDYIRREGLIHLYDAQKWLREEKGIFVFVDAPWKTNDGLGWSYFCCNRPMTEENKDVCFASGGFYDSYEEALLEGVKASVEILKEE